MSLDKGIEAQVMNNLALVTAARSGNIDLMKLLVTHGANGHQSDKIMAAAIDSENLEILKYVDCECGGILDDNLLEPLLRCNNPLIQDYFIEHHKDFLLVKEDSLMQMHKKQPDLTNEKSFRKILNVVDKEKATTGPQTLEEVVNYPHLESLILEVGLLLSTITAYNSYVLHNVQKRKFG